MSRDIAAELQALAREVLGVEAPPEGDLSAALDSVQRLSLLVAIEDHFEIVFEAEDEEAIERFDDVLRLIQTKLGSIHA